MLKRTFVIACLITFVTLSARPVMAGVNILAGLSNPATVGVLADTKSAGFMFQGRYLKSFLPFVSVGQTVGYVRLSGNDTSGGTNSDVLGLSIIPIVTMVQLAPPTPGIKPYINAGVGWYYVSKGTPNFGTLVKSAVGLNTTKAGYTVGGGIIFGFPGPVDFQLDVSYHKIKTSPSTSFVGIQAGVQIGLF